MVNIEIPEVEAPAQYCPHCETPNKAGMRSDVSEGWEGEVNRVRCGDCDQPYDVDHSNHIEDDEEALRQELVSLRNELEEVKGEE